MQNLRKEKFQEGRRFVLGLAVFLCMQYQYAVLSEESSRPVCPSQCLCTTVRIRPALEFKIKCGIGENKLSSILDLNLQELPFEIYQLDLSDNNITQLSQEAFTHFPLLQKLNLSRNYIHTIENEAFANLTNLKRLDMSSNRLKTITAPMFAGLENLEKLAMSSFPNSYSLERVWWTEKEN